MHIIVCIKQVPNTADVRIDPKTNTLIREGVESIINPFDMYAIEEGIRLREKYGGKVTVLTMGPMQAQDALKEAISMGADEAVLLSDRAFAGSDTLATSHTLASAIKKLAPYDIILCGKQASDGDTAQVGPGIAVHLDLPQITYVKKIEEIKLNDEKGKGGYIRAERLLEEGYESIESTLPVMITVVKEINEPRMPSLKGKIKASKLTIPVWNAVQIEANPEKIGLRGSPTVVNKIFSPPKKTGGKILQGDTKQVVEDLVKELNEKKILC
jgi:electron transfer flavoprotein beta subunit